MKEICLKCKDESGVLDNTGQKVPRKFSLKALGERVPWCEINGIKYPLQWGEVTCIQVEESESHSFRFYTEETVWGKRFQVESFASSWEVDKIRYIEYVLSDGLSHTSIIGKKHTEYKY